MIISNLDLHQVPRQPGVEPAIIVLGVVSMSDQNTGPETAESQIDKASLAAARRAGLRAGLSIPGLSIFATMLGYSAISRDGGFDLWMTLATTGLVWGMPGQVAMVTLHTAGASVLVIMTAVALANMRMLLMTVSGMAMMNAQAGDLPFWKKLIYAQMLAITSWLQIGIIEGRYHYLEIRAYFTGMASVLYIIGMTGTGFGYLMSDWVDPRIMLAVMVATPLYILLMVINARRMMMRAAGVLGGVLCPLLYPFIGEWSILVGGLVGGSLIVAFWPKSGHQLQQAKRQG